MSVGMNWNPIDIHSLKMKYDKMYFHSLQSNLTEITQQIEKRKKRWNNQIKDFPSPYQYLKDNIHITSEI